ncbi:UNVERIFIED_CONTAM: hypothetical protein NCL1_22628 [Trichonephila clavipes]
MLLKQFVDLHKTVAMSPSFLNLCGSIPDYVKELLCGTILGCWHTEWNWASNSSFGVEYLNKIEQELLSVSFNCLEFQLKTQIHPRIICPKHLETEWQRHESKKVLFGK